MKVFSTQYDYSSILWLEHPTAWLGNMAPVWNI